MTWRLLHRLLGWDFVHLENSCDAIVRRVRRTSRDERYVTYHSDYLVFIDRPPCGWRVTELTAAP